MFFKSLSCCVCLLFSLTVAPGAALAEDWNKHWSTGAKPEVRVHAGDAAVIIQAVDGNSGIDAHVRTRGWSIGRSGVQVIEHQTGDAIDLEVRVPDRFFSMGERSVQLELRVPREISGDVHTGDGSIKLLGVGGDLRVDTGDGSIRGENLEGSLEARSGDGSVHVGGRFDNVQLHTQDGSVELDAKSGSRLRSSWHLETGDGSVRVAVPADLQANLELRTGDGHIQLNFPGASNERRSEHDTRAQLNGGGPTLLVKTGDGSITVGSK